MNVQQITDLKIENKVPPLWRLAFRPFFIFASIFSVVAILLWQLILNNLVHYAPYGGGYWWHIHEMVFGFIIAIISGFLLTAVQTWTGLRAINNKRLMLLFMLWLSARISLFFPDIFPSSLIILLDISFIPVVAYCLAKPILAIKLYRNLFFIPILSVFTLLNGLMHFSLFAKQPLNITFISYTAILLITFVISVMAGRVVPMFTANGTKTQRVNNIKFLELTTNGSLLLLTLLMAISIYFPIPSKAFSLLFFIAGISQCLRCLRYKPWITINIPLLWSLHLSLKVLYISLILLAFSYALPSLPKQHLWHLLTIGSIAAIILAMISRVSLGHTGNQLITAKVMSIAFICLPLAGILRSLGPWLMPEKYLLFINLSAILWLIAFTLFTFYYAPLLFKARTDGRPG